MTEAGSASYPRTFVGLDLETTGVDDTQCCYAEKTETWVDGPDDISWEWYVKTGDAEVFQNVVVSGDNAANSRCC